MKELSEDERGNLSAERLEEIIQDYGRFMEASLPAYAFEEELPLSRRDIALALLKALESKITPEEKDAVREGIVNLLWVLPSPEEYDAALKAKEKIKFVHNLQREGVSADEIARLWKEKGDEGVG